MKSGQTSQDTTSFTDYTFAGLGAFAGAAVSISASSFFSLLVFGDIIFKSKIPGEVWAILFAGGPAFLAYVVSETAPKYIRDAMTDQNPPKIVWWSTGIGAIIGMGVVAHGIVGYIS